MDATRWARVQALFHEAVELPHPARAAFVAARCPDDEGLARHVLALLDEDARAAPLLDRGLADVAHDVLGAPATVPLTEFGAYRIRHVLGEGGMGVVYLAERADLGSVAAIKILRDAWLSPSRRERFASEQRTLAQLVHPGIARLYDADTLPDGTPWFVMEYVEGEPITVHCARRNAPIAERLRLFRAVCDGGAARAPARDHPSRPQAVERPRDGGRHGEAARLRHREAARRCGRPVGRPHAHGAPADDARLRGARADPR